MGNSQVANERKRSKAIDKSITEDLKLSRLTIRALVLGSEDSGKSAFLKQARCFYGEKFTDEEIATWARHVHRDIVTQVRALLQGAKKLQLKLDPDLCAPFKKGFNRDSLVTKSLSYSIKELWEDDRTQLVWRERSQCNIRDSLQYFVENLDRISSEGYVPSSTDILQTGICESHVEQVDIKIYEWKISLYSIGEMWRYPSKYMRHSNGCHLVMYFVALDEYDEYSSVDEKKLKVDESLEILESVVSSGSISKDPNLLIVMNKADLFRKKLRDVPYRVDYGPYQRNVDFVEPEHKDMLVDPMGSEEQFTAAVAHMSNRFVQVAGKNSDRVLSHTCSVMNTKTFDKLMESCYDVILQMSLISIGWYGDKNPPV